MAHLKKSNLLKFMTKKKTKTQKQLADEIGVTRRALSDWKRQGTDLTDPEAIANRICQSRTPPPKALQWAANILGGETPNASPPESKQLEDFRVYYSEQLSEAMASNNKAAIRFWNDLLLKVDESIRRSEAHSKKLGLETGETIAREEVERILKAVIYAGNACVRSQLKEICQVLASESDPNKIYQKLAPAILGGRIFEGFKALLKAPGKVQLPEWVVDVMQSEGENYLQGVDLKK